MIQLRLCLPAVALLGALPPSAVARPPDPREQTSIDRIASMLVRVGENGLASR